jgi:hypothetical protein
VTKPQLTLTALAASVLFALAPAAPAAGQEVAAPAQKTAEAADRGAAVFKVPSGWMAIKDSQLGPTLLLNPKKPAAMFVSYPKQGETTEALRLRLRPLAAGMFFDEGKGEIRWEVKRIQPHPGDGDGVADIATAKQGDREVQVVTYERTTGARPFLYGYFAMRGKASSAPFIDENGKGVKDFDKLWKTLSN